MRTKTASWFETKIRYEKTMDDGLVKKLTELYVVDAMSFTEAEAKITEVMKDYIAGEFEVQAIKRAPFAEVLISEDEKDDRYFKGKLTFITVDERTEKEVRSSGVFLVQAENIDVARKYLKEEYENHAFDCETVQISETKIIDVYERGKA